MKNIYFVKNEENKMYELWINGECITDCYSFNTDAEDVILDLIHFANIPIYKNISDEMKKRQNK